MSRRPTAGRSNATPSASNSASPIRPGLDLGPEQHDRDLGGRRAQLVGQVGVRVHQVAGEHDLGRAVGQDVAHLRRLEARVDRDDGGAREGGPEQRGQALRRVRHQHGHAVARRDAERGEAARDALRALGQAAVAPALAREDDGVALRVGGGRSQEGVAERDRHVGNLPFVWYGCHMSLSTPLSERIGIEHPFMQAGMGGIGPITLAHLAAAISEAGALGTLAQPALVLEEGGRRAGRASRSRSPRSSSRCAPASASRSR